MRVVTPLFTMSPSGPRFPALAVLEGPPPCSCSPVTFGRSLGDTPPASTAVPPGFTDWKTVLTSTTGLIATEPDAAKSAILKQGLTLATAALPIPGVGLVIAGITAALAFLGITVRGKTQHVYASTAFTTAATWVGANVVPIWRALPADAREKMYALLEAFDRDRLAAFGPWWGGRIATDRAAGVLPASFYSSVPDFPAFIVGSDSPLVNYLYNMIHEGDADTVNEQLPVWFFQPFSDQVLRPLDAFMVKQYNETVAQYRAAGGKGASAASQTLTKSAIGLGLAAALGLPFLFSAFARKRRVTL